VDVQITPVVIAQMFEMRIEILAPYRLLSCAVKKESFFFSIIGRTLLLAKQSGGPMP
jgi:hypothetical protein